MPSRNRVKQYVAGGYYHVYNRGVEKRKIFLDDQDYRVFLYLLKYYLSPPPDSPRHPLLDIATVHLVRPRPLVTLHREVDLLAYCLLPNHFHLLLLQRSREGMQKLLHALGTTYVLYFNKRNHRVGRLFQDTYKAAWIGDGSTGDRYLLHLSRYIHLNPQRGLRGLTRPGLVRWPYSSYEYYLSQKNAEWLYPEPIMNYFLESENINPLEVMGAYKRFVEESPDDTSEILGRLVIE